MPEPLKISLADVPATDVLGTEKTGTYALIPELLMQVLSHMLDQNIPVTGPPVFLCHECSPESVQEANANGTARVEVAWPVTGPAAGSGAVRRYTLPGGKMVHVTHKGPYETCEATYREAFAWIGKNGFTICGPIREVYPNDPRVVPPEEILTEIYLPVR